MDDLIDWLSVATGLLSALCWLRAATVKVGREQALKIRERQAKRRGEPASSAGVSLDGADLSATFNPQMQWNPAGAAFAAITLLLQVLSSSIYGG